MTVTFCYAVTTIGLLRPTLLPGLTRIRRGPRTVQFGVDPRRAVLVELADERAAAILDLLDGAHSERQGPPSAPRISRNRLRRTSGKSVVRWSFQSVIVGSSPGSAGSLPARKSRKLWPLASI